MPNGWISTDSQLLTIDARVFDANTNDFQDVFFNWSPVPGFSVGNFLGDRTNQVRDSVSVYAASISNPAGHSFSVTATGLPAGLAIDPGTGLISGTMADSARRRLSLPCDRFSQRLHLSRLQCQFKLSMDRATGSYHYTSRESIIADR